MNWKVIPIMKKREKAWFQGFGNGWKIHYLEEIHKNLQKYTNPKIYNSTFLTLNFWKRFR